MNNEQVSPANRLDLPAYAMSMATHLLAVLLGGAISSLVQGEAWPAAARQLSTPNVLIALPGGIVEGAGFQPGDRVHLLGRHAGDDSVCALSPDSYRLLASGDVFLLAQDLDQVSSASLSTVRQAITNFSGAFAGVTHKKLALGKGTTPGCGGTLAADVIVDRKMRRATRRPGR